MKPRKSLEEQKRIVARILGTNRKDFSVEEKLHFCMDFAAENNCHVPELMIEAHYGLESGKGFSYRKALPTINNFIKTHKIKLEEVL